MATLKELFAKFSDQKERNIAFQEFQDKAFRHVPAKQIVSLLRVHNALWSNILVGEGNDYLVHGSYSNEINESTIGNNKNALFLMLALDKSAVELFETLKEKADFFEFNSNWGEKILLALFFIKRDN